MNRCDTFDPLDRTREVGSFHVVVGAEGSRYPLRHSEHRVPAFPVATSLLMQDRSTRTGRHTDEEPRLEQPICTSRSTSPPEILPLAIKVAQCTITHMQDSTGYFHYRRYSPGQGLLTKLPHSTGATRRCSVRLLGSANCCE